MSIRQCLKPRPPTDGHNVLSDPQARARFRQFVSNGPIGVAARKKGGQSLESEILDGLFDFMDTVTNPRKKTDETAYIKAIRSYVWDQYKLLGHTAIPNAQEQRAKWSIDEVLRYLDKAYPEWKVWMNPTHGEMQYMGVGCGNGLVTKAMSEHFHLGKDSAVGADIFPPPESKHYTGKLIDFTLPSPLGHDIVQGRTDDNAFDFIPNFMTLLTVLHHAANPIKLLEACYQSLAPGGIVIVREHDYPRDGTLKENRLNHDLQHCAEIFYSTIYPSRIDSGMECPEHYNSLDDWVKIFKDTGFNVLLTERVQDQPLRPFYAVLQKPQLGSASRLSDDLIKVLLSRKPQNTRPG